MNQYEIALGTIKSPWYSTAQLCTVEIRLNKNPEGLSLAISGSLWNCRHTDITQGGQMQDTIREALNNTQQRKDKPYFRKLNYPYKTVKKLLDIWDHWHLNDLRAGCEHQRDLLNNTVQFPNHEYTELIKFPEFSKCPKCGYAYGSKWLYEALPKDVVQFIKDFAGDKLQEA